MYTVEPYSQFPQNTHVNLNSFTKDKIFKKLKLNDSNQAIKISLKDSHSQAKSCLSRIQDPLWKSVCTEMLDIMGPFSVYKIWNGKLGSYSDTGKTMEFCCPTDEVAQFMNQYSFLILGSLQRYFPTLKHLKVKIMQTS
jgi:hypothetical protein